VNERALNALVDMVEEHLSKYSPEEQERRIAAVERRLAAARRGGDSAHAKRSGTPATRVRSRGRGR